MNKLDNFIACLIELLEDDFDGDFQITRSGLLEYIKKAQRNAEVLSRYPKMNRETWLVSKGETE